MEWFAPGDTCKTCQAQKRIQLSPVSTDLEMLVVNLLQHQHFQQF